MQYNKTPPAHDFDGVEARVYHGYDVARDLYGYMIRLCDTSIKNHVRNYTIMIKTKTNGEIVGIQVDG